MGNFSRGIVFFTGASCKFGYISTALKNLVLAAFWVYMGCTIQKCPLGFVQIFLVALELWWWGSNLPSPVVGGLTTAVGYSHCAICGKKNKTQAAVKYLRLINRKSDCYIVSDLLDDFWLGGRWGGARGVATGVYRYIYPQKSTLQIFMWLLVVFFSLWPRTNSISCQCAP